MEASQILESIDTIYKKKIKVWPCSSNRASSLGDPCIRKLVYMRTDWKNQLLPDMNLIKVFEEGNEQEKFVKKLLVEAGYYISESQRSIADSLLQKFNITGHIDFYISKDEVSKPYVAEVKSMHPNIFQQINTESDFEKYPWTKKYIAQFQIYLFGSGDEYGFMILKNKSTGEIKVLKMKLNLDYVESLLKKAEAIEKHIIENTLPDRIEDFKECKKCQFNHICTPDIINNMSSMIVNDKLESLLNKREKLKSGKQEYDKADKELKEILKQFEYQEIIIGDFQITKNNNRTKIVKL